MLLRYRFCLFYREERRNARACGNLCERGRGGNEGEVGGVRLVRTRENGRPKYKHTTRQGFV